MILHNTSCQEIMIKIKKICPRPETRCVFIPLNYVFCRFGTGQGQLEFWGASDYFSKMIEHISHGMMLMGAPHPADLLADMLSGQGQERKEHKVSSWLCCMVSRTHDDELVWTSSGQEEGILLSEDEVLLIRQMLLLLLVAADQSWLHRDKDEFARLLVYSKRVCIFFQGCATPASFADIKKVCTIRLHRGRPVATT
jgi:hypothetical protein